MKTNRRKCSTFHFIVKPIRKALFLPLVLLLLTGCNLVLSRAPGLYILESGLGQYENRPTWFWEVYGPDVIQGFRYSFESENNWKYVGEKTRIFQPIEPLDTGKYTLYLQAQTAAGYWSRTVSETAIVATSQPFRPNDPYFSGTDGTDGVGQWALEAIGMPALWGHLKYLERTGTVRKEVVVAVVDTGYTRHPDLEDNLLIEDGYDFIKDSGVSGDGDSDIDDDATDPGDGNPPFIDHSWHGTTVSGVIAALTDNGTGIAGIGLSKVKVLPVRALGRGGGTTYDVDQAIRYAAGLPNDSGKTPAKTAKIINLSLGHSGNMDEYIDLTLPEVAANGIIVVAAAGNSRGKFGVDEVDYPAFSDYTIAVAATTYHNKIAPYSNPGDKVDISAPGGRGESDEWTDWVIVASPDPGADHELAPDDYTYLGNVGTSISSPHVAGILALLCTVDDSMDLAMAQEVLRRSATDLGEPGWDRDFGHGLVNGLAAFGAYRLLLDSGWMGYLEAKRAPVRRPLPADAQPTGELAENSLIVRYLTEGTAKSITAAGRLRALGALPTAKSFGRDLVVKPETGVDPAVLRARLLAEPDIEAVFYNYRYRPL